MVFIPPVEFRDLQNQRQGALKLFWLHIVANTIGNTVMLVYTD